ncbi:MULTISPECIES: DUF5674 family protein [Nostocales]|uniref:Uncharacterized protein n=2 Tax=Calothrix TaxID=1186 RepID=A0ABR8ALD7_9CYAN|nr:MULTISPECIES: DUF5674 family protein [Nostocales]MBD2200833.1 hypothetical protein [Calothrix parietina FACHB-288]MBD2229870.1 hypothetical protein [Calothrix anomala FACHB-343]MBD2359334.1 hypothetical protein [Tolypothrix sp. FACHB-123]BAY66795.1 hypothetical protein NIES22_69390 [Calothrix brevissima NIES-22]
MILLLRNRATSEQLEQMLIEHKFYIKTAVDIERRVLVGGGELHVDCEQVLLDDGSRQQDIWAASFMPVTGRIICESMVNLRPRQNRSMEILDSNIRERVAQIIIEFLGNL